MRDRFLIAALTSAALLAGCSGGGGGGSVLPGNNGNNSTGQSAQAQTESAVADANAVGSPIKDFATFDKASVAAFASNVRTAQSVTLNTTGTCNSGVEFWAPDKNNDPNSTETIDFYDSGCTSEARDLVRIYTSTSSSSETVNLNESLFAPLNGTPIATRTETHSITAATFNQYGYPIAADGYNLVSNNTLSISGSRTIDSDDEFVLAPASSGTNNFCSDSAGFNATGFARLGETFGWQGGVLSGGSRTINSDGSVTWTATHSGTAFKGSIGGLSVHSGVQNTSCPISTPMFTLDGGTSLGSYSIPIVATLRHGMLESLTITNGTLASGDTLNVSTNTSQPPSSSQYITGVVSSGTTQIATFAVDAFGDGTLTVTSNGAQFVITDWHVVR